MSDNHVHEEVLTHTHEHGGHTHEHTHAHGGEEHVHGAAASSPEEAVALLRYMLSHNQHHADELHDLAHCFELEIADLVHDAVDHLQDSNSCIEQALSLIENSQE